MVGEKMKIFCSVKVSKLEFVSLPIADHLQSNFYKLPCVEPCTVLLNALNFYLHTFVFNIFYDSNTLYLNN